MCACGCLLLLFVAGGIAWAAIHGLWLVAFLIVAASAAIVWFGQKNFRKPKKPLGQSR